MRLDKYLVTAFSLRSRTYAENLLKRGAVTVNGTVETRPSCEIDENNKRILDSGKVEFLRANARDLPPIPEKDFVCADVSFISVTLILDSVRRILRENGKAVLLVKPQFELGRAALDKRGIVKNERLSRSALDLVSAAAVRSGFAVTGSTEIPRLFEDKNVEYLLLMTPVKNASSIA